MTDLAVERKSVLVVSPRASQGTSVTIAPQDTASDILEKAGLSPRDMLLKPGAEAEFAPTDLPFEEVPDGAKLYVVPASTVGGRPWA